MIQCTKSKKEKNILYEEVIEMNKPILKPNNRLLTKTTFFTVLVTLVCIILPSVVWGQTYYVDTTGNDGNPGTLSQPWKTISKANSTLIAGDTVYIRAGTYGTIEPANTGTSNHIITYQNYNGEDVQIKGTNLYDSYRYDLILANKSYINIIGIDLSKPPSSSRRWFILDNVSHVLVKDCDFKDGYENFAYSMSKINNMSYCVFDNCSWDASNTDEESNTQNDLFRVDGDSDHNLWINCHFGNVSHSPVHFESNIANYFVFYKCKFDNKWRHGLNVRFGPFMVEKCIFADIGKECSTCPWFSDRCTNNRVTGALYTMAAKKGIIRENTFYNCDWTIDISMQFDDTKDSWIYHNTAYNAEGHGGSHPDRGILLISESGGATIVHDNNIINNVFAESENSKQIGAYNYNDPAYNPVDNVISYNLIYDKNTNKVRWGTTIGTVEYVENNHDDWIAGTNIVADPLFVDPNAATPDFNLQLGSPAINAGRCMTLANGSGANSVNLKCDEVTWAFSGPNPPWNIDYPGIEADKIYFQQSDNSWVEREVTGIDYDTKTITLNSTASWDDNTKIYHKKFNDSAPDMGAYEYGGTGISKEKSLMPNSLSLSVNSLSDNSVVFNFILETPDNYSLNVYNIAGKKVWCHNVNKAKAGKHHMNWDLNTMGNKSVKSGIYFAVLKTGGNKISKYFVVLN